MNDKDSIFKKREKQQYNHIDELDTEDVLLFIKNINVRRDRHYKDIENIKSVNSEKEDPTFKKSATIQNLITRYLVYFEGRSKPLPANNKKQIKHYNDTQKDIKPYERTLLLEDGTKSCSYKRMRQTGQSAKQVEKKEIIRRNKCSIANMGRLQTNSLEGAGINAFIKYLNKMLPEEMENYEFMFIYDNCYADLAIRHKDWSKDKYVMLQFKTAQTEAGKILNFNIGGYNNDIYIVCLGLTNYEPKEIRKSADDVDECELEVIYFVGTTDKKSFQPTMYLKNPNHDFDYIYIKYDGKQEQQNSISFFLDELEEDNYLLLSRNEIMYERGISKNHIKEKNGIRCIEDILNPHGFTFEAPMCQNESVDVIINHRKFNGKRYNISFKTSLKRKLRDNILYFFRLNAHPQSHLVDLVFVLYNNEDEDSEFSHVAIIDGQRVYTCGLNSFNWSKTHQQNKDIYYKTTFDLNETKKIKNQIFKILGYKIVKLIIT
jgi:hypothetical protein